MPVLDADSQARVDRLEPLATRLVKQADVVMVMAMFPSRFDEARLRANLDYYEARTLHGSSLSLTPHALVAGRLGRADTALGQLRAAMRYNLDFTPRGGYRNGLHLAPCARGWLALVEGLLRRTAGGDGLRFAPRLPASLGTVRLRLCWRGRPLALDARCDTLTVRLVDLSDAPLRVSVGARTDRLDDRCRSLVFTTADAAPERAASADHCKTA